MILLDSNIFIYAALSEHQFLRDRMRGQVLAASIVSRIEVLGFHRLTQNHAYYLDKLLSLAEMIPLSLPIVDTAIQLRQQRRITLGDAIVAATSLEYDMILWTHNIKDFSWISGLVVHDPLL